MNPHERAKAARQRILAFNAEHNQLSPRETEEDKKKHSIETSIGSLQAVQAEESTGPGIHERARLARIPRPHLVQPRRATLMTKTHTFPRERVVKEMRAQQVIVLSIICPNGLW